MDSIERDLLLYEGKVVGDYWFNEKHANNFIVLVTFAQNNGFNEISWPNKDKVWLQIPIEEAVLMCKYIIEDIQVIYGAK